MKCVVKCVIAVFIMARQNERVCVCACALGEVQWSILIQLDEDQEASVKRGIRVCFGMELVSVARLS